MTINLKKPAALIALTAAASLVIAAGIWWVAAGSKPVSQVHTDLFVGKVALANQQAEEAAVAPGYVCITPNPGEVSDAAAGEDWCGPVYPSEGLTLAGLTPGLEVRALAFNTTEPLADGTLVALRGAIVVPISAPIPGSGQLSNAQVPAQAATEAFAPHLVGLSEADATTAANSLGFAVRVASVDGKANMLTTDFRSNRIELTIANGLVVKTEVG